MKVSMLDEFSWTSSPYDSSPTVPLQFSQRSNLAYKTLFYKFYATIELRGLRISWDTHAFINESKVFCTFC
jgi:hypothetical protein